MQFINSKEAESKELTYQDVFILPQRSNVGSRSNVDVTPSRQIPINIPVIVSNMNAVEGKRMAEAVTRRGGMVVFPQDKSLEYIEIAIRYLKHCHSVYETPIRLKRTDSIQKALNLINKRSHKAAMVLNDLDMPVGIFTESDAKNKDLYTPLYKVMTSDLITIGEEADNKEIFYQLQKNRLNIMPIVNNEGKLVGVLTKKGILRSKIYKPALNVKNQLYTSVAVGINNDLENKVNKLMEMAVDLIVLDTAHGHQEKMIDAIKKVRNIIGANAPLCAGNIVTKEAAVDLIEAGATILKVGVGPGAACTTRMVTGVGRPQFSAVYDVAKIARKEGVDVWADGGCKHPRDVCLALAAGANCAYIASWFVGTYESPADIKTDKNGKYKENFGMASFRAVKDRANGNDAFEQSLKEFFIEGISGNKMYLKDGQESVEDIIDKIVSGVKSACTYTGAVNLEEFYEKAVIGVQTNFGYQEGKPVMSSW